MSDEPYIAKLYRDRKSWLEGRRNSLGGSEVGPALFGKGYGTPAAIQALKLGLIPEDSKPALHFRAALALEQTGAEDAEEKLGLPVVAPSAGGQVIYHSREVPHAHATPDRFVVRERPGKIHARTLPAKAVHILSLKTWNPSRKSDWQDDIPVYALIQMQMEMLVLKIDSAVGHVMFGVGDDSMVTPVIDAHPAFHERLRNEIPAWWEKHIEKRIPCPPVAEDADLLRTLYPTAKPGSFVMLTGPEWQTKYARLTKMKALATKIENKCEGIEVEIKDALKDSEFAIFDDGACSWKSFKRNEAPRPARTIDVRSFRTGIKVPKGIVP